MRYCRSVDGPSQRRMRIQTGKVLTAHLAIEAQALAGLAFWSQAHTVSYVSVLMTSKYQWH